MEDAAAEPADDVREVFGQIAEFTRRGQRRVAEGFEGLEAGLQPGVGGGDEVMGGPKEPGKSAVEGVCCPDPIRVDGNPHIRSVRPVLMVFFVEPIRLGLEIAGFSERQLDFPSVAGFVHRQIAPGRIGCDRLPGVGGNDFAAPGGGGAQVGAQAGRPVAGVAGLRGIAARPGGLQRKTEGVTHEAQKLFAGCGRLDWLGMIHLEKFYQEATSRKG